MSHTRPVPKARMQTLQMPSCICRTCARHLHHGACELVRGFLGRILCKMLSHHEACLPTVQYTPGRSVREITTLSGRVSGVCIGVVTER